MNSFVGSVCYSIVKLFKYFTQIVKEIMKCGCLVLLSTFLFAQASTFSIKLAGYTGSIFTTNNVTLGDSMLSLYVEHSDGYKESDEFKNDNILYH